MTRADPASATAIEVSLGHRVRRRWWLTAAIVWSILVLIACSLPASSVPKPEAVGLHIPFLDRWAHVAIFGLWGGLWWVAAGSRGWGPRVLLAGVLYGALTELVQDWLGWGRSADLADWVSDILGVSLGILSARGVYRMIFDRPSSRKAEETG
jgi:hypothetical protein